MAYQEKLLKQVIEKLQLDTGVDSLVTLTRHTEKDRRIARDEPPTKGKKPFLGIAIPYTGPLNTDTTFIKRSRVEFIAYGEELSCIRILDRLEYLLDDKDGQPTNKSYYDFSGDDISTKQVRFKSRVGVTFDGLLDVWTGRIEAEVIWSVLACP